MSEENVQNLEASERPVESTVEDAALEGRPQEARARTRRRRKVSYLTTNRIDTVDYKDVTVLKRFINEHGKILPSRQTGNTAKQQRMIARAIKRAREMALLPFVVRDLTDEPGQRRIRTYTRD